MWTAIKLVLIYYAMQLAGSLLTMPLGVIGRMRGWEDMVFLSTTLALLLSVVFMTIYLYQQGYLKNDGRLYAPVSALFLLLTLVAGVSFIFCEEFLMSHLAFLPDIMEQTFDLMQTDGLGIFSLAIVGPVLEELLFRGAVTKVLLEKYRPLKAIILSALIFGVFHINPVQVVAAFISGLFLAWLYWRTRSVIPCILFHVLNNSLSVYLNLHYPDVEYISDCMEAPLYYTLLILAACLCAGAIRMLATMTNTKKNNAL
ncbi:MAG: CPBP family intramembrane metalloprotease [Bacteroides sp.]|nr:CPBP family intramembrane metalloprotease [Bacteroides sp.]